MSLTTIQKKIAELTQKMTEAAAAEDFELAARLRNEIEATRAKGVRLPPPGQMGLGTNIPLAAPPKGWKRPKKPDPMTANVKPRGSR
jgi:hypothetical protein